MSSEREYVLGTHDDEIERLGLQHRVWRPRALDGWRRAGFTVGQSILDVGCGPGYATLDLAEIVGPHGRVTGIDRSERFLSFSRQQAAARGLDIRTIAADLDEADLPADVDAAWVRWVFAFVTKPRRLVSRLRRALKPGAPVVIHEYLDYSTWRAAPAIPEFEEFVAAVMKSWRANGGEPDIALDVVRWLEEEGFFIRELRPIVDVIRPAEFVWQWPKAFLGTGVRRLVELGFFSAERAAKLLAGVERFEATPNARMVNPTLLEIIADRGA